METFYCDGSQHKEMNRMGVGVVKGSVDIYYNIPTFDWKRCTHEIIAITKAISFAIKNNTSNIVVVNDDKQLVNMIQKAKVNIKLKSKGFKKKAEFTRLMKLVKEHDVLVRTPQSEFDKRQILKCHHLSRTYLREFELVK